MDGADGQFNAELHCALSGHRDAPVVDAVVDGEQLCTTITITIIIITTITIIIIIILFKLLT